MSVFVQWCVKGVWGGPGGIDEATAEAITAGGEGIRCNWWRNAGQPQPEAVEDRLTPQWLDDHIHNYGTVSKETPFISLTAGCVERDRVSRFNRLHTAEEVALRFATSWGTHPGYLFYCWVIVGLKRAVEVRAVAEEVRELNTYTDWSDFQLEGEITAKVLVPSHQIHRWAYWDPAKSVAHPVVVKGNPRFNPRFQSPTRVSNIRGSLG